jgi:hypothetical protein
MSNKTKSVHFDLGNTFERENANAYGSFPSAKNAGKVPTLPAVNGELAEIKNGLGFIDTIIIDRRLGREAKRILAEGYVQLMEAKRQELVAKITVGLAESKKQLLVESLRMSGEIDKEISNLSAEFSGAIFDGAIVANLAAAEEEHKKLQEIETAFQEGRMTEARHRQLREIVSEAADHIISIVKANVAQIIQAHVGQIKIALELFRERTLGRGF